MSDTTTLTADQMQDAALVDATMAEARATAGTVRYWDETSDPSDPGWVVRTYDADGYWDETSE